VADDAGALLVRSGLVSSNALDDARARVASIGGTLGEQLVTTGAISDDDLTDFYRARLLVPQVNPNMLARLTPKVVATIPSDMAIELRAIPVSLDGDNNLTVAMSDPSDRHAVDEIAFFTGAYVVRAVATQMQIAWCLAHYYGHVTALGHRLLHASESESPMKAAISASAPRPPRAKGLTGRVNATRHRAIAPITGPVDVLRPSSGELDLRPLSGPADVGDADPTPVDPAAMGLASAAAATLARPPHDVGSTTPVTAPRLPKAGRRAAPSKPAALPASTPRSTPISTPSTAPLPGPTRPPASAPASGLGHAPDATTSGAPAATSAAPPGGDGLASAIVAPAGSASPPSGTVPRAAPDAPTLPPVDVEPTDPPLRVDSSPESLADSPTPTDGAPEKPRARSVSGEIRVPVRRAPSIRPPISEPEDEDDEPLIMIERGGPGEDDSAVRPLLPRRRIVKSDPPELYARAGEVDLKTGGDRTIDADEPRIVIDEDALSPPTAPIDTRSIHDADTMPPMTKIDVTDDADTAALIHDRVVERESQPILLDRPRATPQQLAPPTAGAAPARDGSPHRPDSETDTGEIDIVVLDARKQPRPERRTQVGIPPAPVPVNARPPHDTEAMSVPTLIEQRDSERLPPPTEDRTMIDLRAAPPGEDSSSDQLAAPPSPASDADTNPYLIAPPPKPAPASPSLPPRSAAIQPAVLVDDDDDGDDEPRGPRTSEMSAAELDDAVPERTAEFTPEHLARRRIEHDAVDDGWGPPGTTIPPPLLGAIPGSEDDEAPNAIPMPNVDSSPLMVGPPSPSAPPSTGAAGGRALVRALEHATARAIEVIRQLERAQTRDEVVDVMVAHLAETHHRAGFFVTRHGVSKGASELGVFVMTPKPEVMPFATLRLDRPSTLQDVVGTRLPYRGPMHDDASRAFLVAILGACPPEILLVPVAVRERVVGVLFGEHRLRHTFDDQLALAARAAGMALERILKARRS
jgi:hypothetical protein